MFLKALDTIHVSSVSSDNIISDQTFEIDDLRGRSLIERGLAVEVDAAAAAKPEPAAKAEAQRLGLGLMVGCMVGSSLAMAPAVLLAQGAQYCDLDGPLLLSQDREVPLDYDAQGVHPPVRALWG